MPDWTHHQTKEIDGIELVVKTSYNPREYLIEARIGGRLVHFERVSRATWEGHCLGQLLLPAIATRAKARADDEIAQKRI